MIAKLKRGDCGNKEQRAQTVAEQNTGDNPAEIGALVGGQQLEKAVCGQGKQQKG